MSSKHVIGQEVSVDEQGLEDEAAREEEPLRPTVDMQVAAKVDANHPDAGFHGLTLAAEEKALAREAEKARTRKRWDRRQSSDREARTRRAASAGSKTRREAFVERRTSVDPWADPERADPRAWLSQDDLAAVNHAARRIAEEHGGWTAAAVSKRIAKRMASGIGRTSAVIRTVDELKTAPGTVVPIGELEEVSRREVSIEGELTTLWESDSPAIAQVGLIADDTGQTKLTVWKKSNAPWIEEGEQVRIHGAAKNWYDGRVSVAVTGWSTVHFPERDAWWEA